MHLKMCVYTIHLHVPKMLSTQVHVIITRVSGWRPGLREACDFWKMKELHSGKVFLL